MLTVRLSKKMGVFMLTSRMKRMAVSVVLITALIALALVYKKIVKLYMADNICMIQRDNLE